MISSHDSSQPMKIAIVGCGAVARYCHAPALRRMSDVSISAVADPAEDARASVSRGTSASQHHDAEDLLNNCDADAVVISVPTDMHAAVAMMAARAGKPFYLEKPIAATKEEAAELRSAVDIAGVPVAVGFNRRAHPLYVRAREIVLGGSIGEIHAVQSTFSEPAPKDGLPQWKLSRATGGGVLLDLASHHVDLIRWLTGGEISSVLAAGSSGGNIASLGMHVGGGIHAQCFVSFNSAYADWIEIAGSQGTLRLDRHRASLTRTDPRRVGYGPRHSVVRSGISDIGWRARRMVRRSEDPSYYRSLEAFVQMVRGERAPLASLADGERSLEVILAAEESARSGLPVEP